ncbi:MAG: hypothetical protein JO236_02105 [Mycobacterium sp.]|uniref:hypothetical protein n=1 Tax=Mycobacterium sp. TaxID=1785 RepID=UPI001ED5D354|nr:hypothetical protein [Mycobacterium sp.]MBW0016332.1 hypothetical protein [Mycobacterium sp.]
MPDLPILTSPGHSLTLRRLVENLAAIDTHLDNADAWRGAEIADQYIRIEATDSLVSSGAQRREYVVAMHVFPRPVNGDLHDHRWPFAVYPFAAGLPDGTPLYEMPWEHEQRSGIITIGSRYPYAIEDCAVRHAVRGLRPHMSLTVADITDPPTRPNRLAVAALSANVAAAMLAYARDAFRSGRG